MTKRISKVDRASDRLGDAECEYQDAIGMLCVETANESYETGVDDALHLIQTVYPAYFPAGLLSIRRELLDEDE